VPTTPADLDLPRFDSGDPALTGPAFRERIAELAREGWLADAGLGTVVLDREAGELLLRSRATVFPGQKIAELFGIEDGPLREEIDRNVLHLTGAQHRRLRGLVNPFFTPREADRWRPVLRELLAELWDGLGGATSCDAVADLAHAYPARAIAAVVGAPATDADRLARWSALVQRQFDPPSLLADRPAIEQAVEEFYAYCHALLAERRAAVPKGARHIPEPGLLDALLAAEADGDRLSDVECVNLVLNVLVGGVDTTQAQLAHALRLFAEHPEQWALVREDPAARVPGAVQEVCRHAPITPFTARLCVEDVEVRDVTFPAGSIVLVCAQSANAQDAEGFDVLRTGAPRMLTFGDGPHFCLGVNLATAELEEALAFLAPRMPGLRLDGEVRHGSVQGIYALEALPIAWDAAPSSS
jgi:cytochrome P450